MQTSRFEVRARVARGGFYYGVFDNRRQRYTSFPVGSSGMLRRQTPHRDIATQEAALLNQGV